MSLSLGIVGLPNVGKSTLFKALTKQPIEIANYPFCTIAPNVGVVPVPDERLEQLAKHEDSAKIIPAVIEFVDIAGLVAGAHKGEGLGNQFLSHIREVDALAMIVRCFDDPNIIHVSGKVDPQADFDVIAIELMMADLESATKRLMMVEREAKSGDKDKILERDVLAAAKERLEKGWPVRGCEVDEASLPMLKQMNFLTAKPMIVVANLDEEGFRSQALPKIMDAQKNVLPVVGVCAQYEAELSELSTDDAKAFLKEIGTETSGLDRLIRTGYEVLNLLTFFTAGPKETHAWTVERGSAAPKAAGKIHTDFERGFISSEVINTRELLALGSWNAAKAAGKIRMEGKTYVVQDGDVVHFHFSQ